MRRITTCSAVLGAALALCLVAGPAFAVPKDLRVSTATCGGVTVTGQGLPASTQLYLLATNLSNGKVLNPTGKPIPVMSSSAGAVQAKIALQLNGVRTVDVSIWNKKGETLTMMAKDTAATSCGTLPLTGVAGTTTWALLAAVTLLLAGAGALWRARHHPRHAARRAAA
ncbi:MAG TPA: LPXTG cell wall anchor domain-containing protein [Actinomycetes bacterium]|jgi:LPXTG-motif cell wall-anchored protein|nr:LPXTG cell wall anchor domain-containing protein [Actinomycetes bacterium]